MMKQARLIEAMCDFDGGTPKRVHHFLAVLGFAKTIAELEGVDETTLHILETAAIVHDIGIKPSMEKYGDGLGPHQEAEGPAYARPMLEGLGYAPEVVDRVCFLISKHHTYKGVDGLDWRILLEADFLVNAATRQYTPEEAESVASEFFETKSGMALLKSIYRYF